MKPPIEDADFHARFSRRVQVLTLVLGWATALIVGITKMRMAGYGIGIGAFFAWLNFRWLDQGLQGFVDASKVQEGRPQPIVPLSTYVKFGGRYALIGIALCGIVAFLGVPAFWLILGLLALGLAVAVEGLYEVFSGI